MSVITRNHWINMIMRVILLVLNIISYNIENIVYKNIISIVTWVFFIFSMIARIIPNNTGRIVPNSMGHQKIFKKNYIENKDFKGKVKRDYHSPLGVALVWMLLNCNIFILYFTGYLNADLLFIISLIFSVCDLVCILIICPFQVLYMRNKCCNTCRIYNWDYPMMFTPLWVVPSFYNYSLVALSWVVLIIWEVGYYKHPERFVEESNACLSCKNCKEFMCKNKWRRVK